MVMEVFVWKLNVVIEVSRDTVAREQGRRRKSPSLVLSLKRVKFGLVLGRITEKRKTKMGFGLLCKKKKDICFWSMSCIKEQGKVKGLVL